MPNDNDTSGVLGLLFMGLGACDCFYDFGFSSNLQGLTFKASAICPRTVTLAETSPRSTAPI